MLTLCVYLPLIDFTGDENDLGLTSADEDVNEVDDILKSILENPEYKHRLQAAIKDASESSQSAAPLTTNGDTIQSTLNNF